MRRGTLSRVLLSLLMLWQLGASVFAHSIMGAQVDAAPAAAEAPCHDMDMSGMAMDETASVDLHTVQSVERGHFHDYCKSVCKCPCAGTPALSFVFPLAVRAAPDSVPLAAFTSTFDSISPASLLRPPI